MSAGRRLATRDVTRTYVNFRQKYRQAVAKTGYEQIPGSDSIAEILRIERPPAIFERNELQPDWFFKADDARDLLKEGWDQLALLEKAQKKRLVQVFTDKEDAEIVSLTKEVTTTIRKCEKTIQEIKTMKSRRPGEETADPATDQETRLNVQRKFAAELSQLNKQCRETQRKYSDEMKRRANAARVDEGGPSAEPLLSGTDAAMGGPQQTSLGVNADLDRQEDFAANRTSEIMQIASSVHELNAIFKETAVIVIDQGTILDRIDYNMEEMVKKAERGKEHVKKAASKKKTSDQRAYYAMLVLAAVNLLLLLILLCKLKMKYGFSFQGMLTFILVAAAGGGGTYLVVRYKPEWCFKICPRASSWVLPTSANPDPPQGNRFQRFAGGIKNAVGLGGGAGSPPSAASAGMQAAGTANRLLGPQAAASVGMGVTQMARGMR